eukprot:EG_transcript_15674
MSTPLMPLPEQQQGGHWRSCAAMLGVAAVGASLSTVLQSTNLFHSISIVQQAKAFSSIPTSALPVSVLQRSASIPYSRSTFVQPAEGQQYPSVSVGLPTPATRTQAPISWVVAALVSFVLNGVLGALLWSQWRSPQRRTFILAATTGDSEAAEVAETTPEPLEKEATDDEQADSPKAKLEVELEEVKAKLAEVEKKYLYALAEIETVRRRGRQQVEDAQKFGIEKFASSILEVADNMARGLAWVPKEVAEGPSGEENPNPELRALYGGMRSTERIMLNILERHGIQKYDPIGEVYDPNLARAIAQVPMPNAEPGTVIQVSSAGYILNGRVLRAADVVVVQDPQG